MYYIMWCYWGVLTRVLYHVVLLGGSNPCIISCGAIGGSNPCIISCGAIGGSNPCIISCGAIGGF